MTLLEAKTKLAGRLNINYSDIANNDLFSESDLETYINTGAMLAWDFHFWDFSEHTKTATLEADDITNQYIPYPEDMVSSSIFYFAIDGKEHSKRDFVAWKRWFEDRPSDTKRIYTEFKRRLWLNVNAVSSGDVVDFYGKKTFTKLTDDADLLFFAPEQDDNETSGNEAIIHLAYAEALASDKKKDSTKAENERKKGIDILTLLRDAQNEGRSLEQQQENKGMFNVPDYFASGNRRNTNIGRFSA